MLRLALVLIIVFCATKANVPNSFAGEKYDYYAMDFPKQRLEFWQEISDQVGHMNFDKTLETLKNIDEFSDDSGLTLFEFRTYITIKLICLRLNISGQLEPTEYLDRLAGYTRKSKQWQNEIFVIEYFFSVFYASLGEYEKSKEALNKFVDLIDDRHSEWIRWHHSVQQLPIYYHAACVYARLGEYDKSVNMCDDILAWDISSWKIDTQHKKQLDEIYKRLRIEPKALKALMDEVREKKMIFSTKKEFKYECHCVLSANYGNEMQKFHGYTMFFHWYLKEEEESVDLTQNSDSEKLMFISWYLELPEVPFNKQRFEKNLDAPVQNLYEVQETPDLRPKVEVPEMRCVQK